MRRLAWLTPALVAVALTAGCGGSSSSDSTRTTGSTASAPAGGTSTPGAASTSTGAGASSKKPAGTAAAKRIAAKLLVNACKRRIEGAPSLRTRDKVKLESLCQKSAGGVAAARQADREVCAEIIERSGSPGSASPAARKQALAACKSAE